MLVVVALTLAGCAAESPPVPTPSASASSPSAPDASASVSPLVPVVPDGLTPQTAQAETERIAGELIAIIDPTSIVNDDEFSQEVPATEGEGTYWGVLHTLTLDPAVDSAATAEQIAGRMTDAGWIARDGTNQNGSYLIALSSSEDAAASWFVIVGADASVPGESVVSLQLASPTLP